jgi:hypothetical protein
MAQLWKSAKKSVAFGSFLLMRIPTAAWKSLAKDARLSHIFHEAQQRYIHMKETFLKTIRGGRGINKWCEATLTAAAGVVRY